MGYIYLTTGRGSEKPKTPQEEEKPEGSKENTKGNLNSPGKEATTREIVK
jgi:hypothetical protein